MKELTFHRWLLHTAERKATNIAFVDQTVPEDVSTHVERSLRLAAALAAQGVRQGDRVAIAADASRFYINFMHAAALGGTIAVPVNTRLTVPELAALLAECEPAVVVTDTAHCGAVELALKELPVPPVVVLTDGETADGHLGLAELAASAEPVVPPEPEEDTPLLMLHTGGTSGVPKGALTNNRQLLLQLYRQHVMIRSMDDGMTVLSVNPLFHIGGCFNAAYGFPGVGNTVVMRPSFDPDLAVADAAAHPITHLPVVVSVLQRILDHPAFDAEAFASLRYIMYGASPIPPKLLARVVQTFPGVEVQQNYGMTETLGAVTCLTMADHQRGGDLLGSVGRVCLGVHLTIRDSAGAEVPTGAVGEICIASGSTATRYWHSPEEPGQAWLATGDVGRFDEDGYLYVVDRLKDMIITGGENVYSVEVERVMSRHPDVESAAVIGLPDPDWGERVHAVIRPRPGAALTPAELIAYARQSLAGYKLPKSIDIRSEPLPVSAVGKVLKRALREEHTSVKAERS